MEQAKTALIVNYKPMQKKVYCKVFRFKSALQIEFFSLSFLKEDLNKLF